MALGKQTCIFRTLRQLPQNASLVFLDADITLLEDPLLLMPRGYDLVLTDDSTFGDMFTKYNIGFFMARNTHVMRQFGEMYLSKLAKQGGNMDQDLVIQLIRKHGPSMGLRTHVLDPTVFMNGHRFYENRDAKPVDLSRLAAVHHNFILGDANKWKRAVAYDALMRPAEAWPLFRQRLRDGVRSLPQWSPQDKAAAWLSEASRAEAEKYKRGMCEGFQGEGRRQQSS